VVYSPKHGPITVMRLGRTFRVRKPLAVRGLTRERTPPVKGPVYTSSASELALPRLYGVVAPPLSSVIDRRSESSP